MTNTYNNGIANGVLLDMPEITKNRDGSRKATIKLMCSDMEHDENGKRKFTKIILQGFIPKTCKNNGPYDYLRKGEEIHTSYTVKSNPRFGISLQIDEIKFGSDIKYHMYSDQNNFDGIAREKPKAPLVNDIDDLELEYMNNYEE